VLRGNRAIARATPDQQEVWDGELTLPNVNVTVLPP
jgi:hypothetical protein